MKIGILTFHSQINYGGVLQCWALQTALQNLGHDVVVVDRWLSQGNEALKGASQHWGIKGWVKFIVRGMLGLGDWRLLRRHRKTARFIKKNLKLTSYHFVSWKDAPRNLGIDAIVVGSDQVWHCGDWGDPSVYLLCGADKCDIPFAISYAASFGLRKLPLQFVEMYKVGLARFKAISCREREGVKICGDLGFKATHVVDPTLLLSQEDWRVIAGVNIKKTPIRRQKIVCYFMSVDWKSTISCLKRFSEVTDCDVEILVNGDVARKPIPRSLKEALQNYKSERVKPNISASPDNFLRTFSEATWVVTDSFHAVMFSSIFECNVRFVRPSNAMRAAMFARAEEFASRCVKGELFADNVDGALESFKEGDKVSFDQSQIADLRKKSFDWLNAALSV